ncbi:adenine methylase [Salmonella phage VB_ST_SPNIS2]|nr:adenine methylase [Salmonella phage VB_ST_SPNIS2]
MTGKYTLIYADPPWVYRDKAADGERGAGFKYPVMNVLDICRLPVWDLAAEDCLLAMWWVPTQPVEALKVIEAWGFRLMTMKGFTWHKTNKHKGNSAIGMGHMTRANSEDCLFAVRGKLPARMDASICQHVTAPRMENSRKPDVIREKLVQLLGDVPRIELFARQSSHGFDVWGNQCDGPAVQLQPGYARAEVASGCGVHFFQKITNRDGGSMTMFNEAELIRQLEEQRAVIVQKSAQVNWLQTENSVLHKKCEELQMAVELQREFIKSRN